MPAFIEECRYEWKRLGVPDSMAEEMATELEADLAEAQADGVSAAEILGESDPRRFAATWARERGLISEPGAPKRRRRKWPWIVVAFVFFFFVMSWLALQSFGSGTATVGPVHVAPLRSASVPNVIGMKACKAVRKVARSGVGVDDWRVVGHQHGYTCDETVVGQSPVGHVIRRDGHPVIVRLRLGRS